jgi:hypothetical protein
MTNSVRHPSNPGARLRAQNWQTLTIWPGLKEKAAANRQPRIGLMFRSTTPSGGDPPGQIKTINRKYNMNKSRCPHCGFKLGNFLYADACPQCHEELKHNTKRLIPAPKKDPQLAQPWLTRIFFGVVRFVES